MKLVSMKASLLMLLVLFQTFSFAQATNTDQMAENRVESPNPVKTESHLEITSATNASNDTTKAAQEKIEAPRVILKTTHGEIVIELNAEKAPISVANFLQYVDSGFYNNTLFHRVIKGFMIQGGGFNTNFQKKPTKSPIKNEAKNGLKNIRGSIAMARTQIVDSGTSQFFINLDDNTFLDHGVRDFGYAVFGQVIKGMDIVDKIGTAATTVKMGMRDVPIEGVKIEQATRLSKATINDHPDPGSLEPHPDKKTK